MFEKFGKMDLCGLNSKAEELLNAGETQEVRDLAAENGLADYAEAYIDGETDYLCEDVMDAALARIDLEADDLGAEEIMGDWADYIRSLIVDSDEFTEKVMQPEKSFKGCVGVLAGYSITHAEPLDQDIIKAMDKAVTDAQLKKLGLQRSHLKYTKIGMPGIATAKRLIREYYEEV
ncbi:MAG: hypothetical protein ACSW8H_07550 [bacterium]